MQVKIIFNKLQELGFAAYGPKKLGKDIVIRKLKEEKETNYSGVVPKNTFKKFFFPVCEKMFHLESREPKETKTDYPKVAVWGINLLDLKALGLYDLVFENDPHYQKRRETTFVVGASSGLPGDYADYKTFAFELKENILEHLRFDIFLAFRKNGRASPKAMRSVAEAMERRRPAAREVAVWSGSSKGANLLEKTKIKDFKHIQFAGFIPEEGPDKRMTDLRKVMENTYNSKAWDELGKICLACGKCSIACPTCFCFDFIDEIGCPSTPLRQAQGHSGQTLSLRNRVWGDCFYDDFTRIAGPHQFLKNPKEKIRFWYRHKFLRIPHEYNYPGCVGCGRCTKVCPVDIDIEKVLMKLMPNEYHK